MNKKTMSKAGDPGCFNGFLSVVSKMRHTSSNVMKEHLGGAERKNEVRFLNRNVKKQGGWFLSDFLDMLGRRLPCTSGNIEPSSLPEKSTISAVAGKVSLAASTTSTSCSTPCGPSESGPSSIPLVSKPATSTASASASASTNDTPSSTSSPAAALASQRIVSEGLRISACGSGSESATTRRTEYSSNEVPQTCFFSMNDSELASPNQRSFGPRQESSSSFSDEDSEKRKLPSAEERCSIVDLYNANWGEKHSVWERITGHRSLITRSGEDMSSTMTKTTQAPLRGGVVNIKKGAKMRDLCHATSLGPDDLPSTNPHDLLHHQTIKSDSSNAEKSISQSGNKDDPSLNSSILGSSGGDHIYFQHFSSPLSPSSRTSGGSRATVSQPVINHRGVFCEASSSSSSSSDFPSDKKPVGGRRASSAPSRISTCSSSASTRTRTQSEGTRGISKLSHHHHHHHHHRHHRQGEQASINARKKHNNYTTLENLYTTTTIDNGAHGIKPGGKANWSPRSCQDCEKAVRKIKKTEREVRKKEQQIAACLEDFEKQEPSANKRVLGQFRVLLNYWKMQDDLQRSRC